MMWNLAVVLVAVFIYCYTSPFYQLIKPASYSITLPKQFDGPLAVNNVLEKADRLHEDSIHWPESFAVHKDQIYTGLGDGRIVRITDKTVVDICRTGNKCEGQHEEHICGRPLGMAFSKTGRLYVVDAYLGLFSIDIKTGKKTNILPSNTIVDDLPLTFLNSIALNEKEGTIYMTQSSSRHNISMVMVSIIEHDTSGRLLKYNPKTKEVTVLLKDLAFPNGIEVTYDGTALLVAEGSRVKIFKYFIKGEKAGLTQELPIVLPGEPDNISRSSRGNYWVAIPIARTQDSPAMHDRLNNKPFWRSLLIHVHRLATAPLVAVLNLLPYEQARTFAFELQSLRILADILPTYGLVLEFDDNGNIVQSLHSPSGKVGHLSEVLEHNGYLYLGSWRNRYLGRLKV